MATNMGVDSGPVSPPLAGTKGNPAHDPTSRKNAGKDTVGDRALMDSIVLVGGAWVALVLLWYSVRNHNI